MSEPTDLDALFDAIFTRPAKGPGARAACGTPAGYYRHRREGDEICDACRQANTDAKNASYAAPVKRPRQLKPIAHGTIRGARQHYYRKDPPCPECLQAQREYQNAVKQARRNGGAQ
ncbi:hypothetical protein [Streptomyces sp. NPDC020298]|uniref:hypothetical protein n=1 Tax=unclassified Streptomyces TaxID=2593676 RepID=UPI0033ED0453